MHSIVRITSKSLIRQRQQTAFISRSIQLWITLVLVQSTFGLWNLRHPEQQRCLSSRSKHTLLNRRKDTFAIHVELQQEHHQNEYVQSSPILHSIIHHTAIKTRNITMAMSFYSLLGYHTEYKFRAGPARAAWLTLPHSNHSRIELIEVPSYMIRSNDRAPDLLLSRPDILGYNHIAMDVTQQIQQTVQHHSMDGDQSSSLSAAASPDQQQSTPSLTKYLQQLNGTSMQRFNKTLRMALYPPRQQMIGPNVYEIAFMYDADGSLIELLHCTATKLQQNMTSGWEPWNSTTFL